MCHLLYLNNLAELQDLSYTDVNLPFLVKVWGKTPKPKTYLFKKNNFSSTSSDKLHTSRVTRILSIQL